MFRADFPKVRQCVLSSRRQQLAKLGQHFSECDSKRRQLNEVNRRLVFLFRDSLNDDSGIDTEKIHSKASSSSDDSIHRRREGHDDELAVERQIGNFLGFHRRILSTHILLSESPNDLKSLWSTRRRAYDDIYHHRKHHGHRFGMDPHSRRGVDYSWIYFSERHP